MKTHMNGLQGWLSPAREALLRSRKVLRQMAHGGDGVAEQMLGARAAVSWGARAQVPVPGCRWGVPKVSGMDASTSGLCGRPCCGPSGAPATEAFSIRRCRAICEGTARSLAAQPPERSAWALLSLERELLLRWQTKGFTQGSEKGHPSCGSSKTVRSCGRRDCFSSDVEKCWGCVSAHIGQPPVLSAVAPSPDPVSSCAFTPARPGSRSLPRPLVAVLCGRSCGGEVFSAPFWIRRHHGKSAAGHWLKGRVQGPLGTGHMGL